MPQFRFETKNFDLLLVATALALSVIGILLIYSGKHASPVPSEQKLFLKQALWLAIGLLAFGLSFLFPLRFHDAFSYFYYLVACLLLLAVLFYGGNRTEVNRWFQLGFFNFQPSEFAKLAIIFALSRYLAYTKINLSNLKWLLVPGILTLIPVALVLKQPHLGTALLLGVLFFFMLLWSGIPLLYLGLLFFPLISLSSAFHWISWGIFFFVFLLILFYFRPAILFSLLITLAILVSGAFTPLVWNKMHAYQKQRILIFLDPSEDPHGVGYQIIQSKVALGSGGTFGKGYLQGTQTKLDFLPEQHTDFIFSVLGEEFGFVGTVLLLMLFLFLIYRGYNIAKKTRNNFASFVAFGITSVWAFQMLVNIGMTLGLTPVTGLPLPFISYGGSSMLFCWIMLGILTKINYHWQDY